MYGRWWETPVFKPANNSVSFLFPTGMQLLCIIIFELKVILFRVKLCENFCKLVELYVKFQWKLLSNKKSEKFGTKGGGIKVSWAILMIEAKYRRCEKILTLTRTRDINKLLVIIPVKVVYQYKYWLPCSYKSCVGT